MDDLKHTGNVGSDSRPYQIMVQITYTPAPVLTATPTMAGNPSQGMNGWENYWNTNTESPVVTNAPVATTASGAIGIVGFNPQNGTGTAYTNPPTNTPAAISLELGSTGSEVRRLQTRLQSLGYYKGVVDGDFGEGTEIAVKSFQQQNGLTVDGKAGTKTIERLYSSSAKRAPSQNTPTPTPRRTATPTPRVTAVPDTDVYLENGSSGTKVRTLQNRLIELGWLAGKADGSYGGATEYAVKAFQKKHGLWEDGKAGPDTLTLLYSTRAAKSSSAVASVGSTLQEGQNSDAVRAMQKRLKELGYFSGSADGSYGQATKAAVIAFQTANDLKADGRAGTATLNLLYSADAKGADSLVSGGNDNDDVTVNGYTTLRKGDRGNAVVEMQECLTDLGYLYVSTGYYDDETVEAVKSFQRRNGLMVNGVADQETLSILYSNNPKPAY